MKTRIIFIGGFLGSGKTTLLYEAALKLAKSGRRVGLITNDQASELVDTAFLEQSGGIVSEVSGSCFCCNFTGLTDAVFNMIQEKEVDVILAEPVGSCTDLSATLFQPLKQQFEKDLEIAPLTVLADPERLSDILNGKTSGLHASAAYIIRKQLEEADIIVINKKDLFTQDRVDTLHKRSGIEWPGAEIFDISAKNGEGLSDWLDNVMNGLEAGVRLAEVDYEIYAEGEAVLGWLNATIMLQGESVDWDHFAFDLVNALSLRFDKTHSAVAHVKLLIQTGNRFVICNLTGGIKTLNIRGTAGMGNESKMTLNARVQVDPEVLKTIVLDEIANLCGKDISSTLNALKFLSPGRPNPTYRYDHIVAKHS